MVRWAGGVGGMLPVMECFGGTAIQHHSRSPVVATPPSPTACVFRVAGGPLTGKDSLDLKILTTVFCNPHGTKASLIANNGTAQSPVSDSMSVAADSGISKTENQTSSSIRSSTTNHTTGATGSKLELHSNETTTYAPQLTTSICVTCNQAERNFSGHPRSNPTESWNDRTSGVILKAPTEPNDTENYSTIKPDMSADDSKTMSPLKGKGFLIPVSCVVVVIGIVVIVFLYKMCQRKPPAAESTGPKVSAQNKESVKLLSVKTATPDSDMKRTTPAHHMEFIAEC
ncbi:endomucin [Rhinophrynus dorsalis]